MARKLRVQYPGAICHVMNRGDRREPIFADDSDRELFFKRQRYANMRDRPLFAAESAAILARFSAGRSMAARTAITAMTTSISIRVKPEVDPVAPRQAPPRGLFPLRLSLIVTDGLSFWFRRQQQPPL